MKTLFITLGNSIALDFELEITDEQAAALIAEDGPDGGPATYLIASDYDDNAPNPDKE